MARLSKLTFFLLALIAVQLSVGADEYKYNEARGQLLYMTHCNSCHTTEIHWREQKLVSDWESLIAQVRRWQYISGYSWSGDEITDVSYYLDSLYYGYKNSVQGKNPIQIMKK